MKHIQVYEAPMCCSTGLCGPVLDPALLRFATMLSQLQRGGVSVERYNLGQQPMAFVQNGAVKALIDAEGMKSLPLIFVDGGLVLKGRYPNDAERDALVPAELRESGKAVQ